MRTGSQLIGENMQEEAQKVLVELLQKASAGIDSAVSFSQAQIPDVIHQLLVWKFTISILFALLAIGLPILWWIILTKVKKFVPDERERIRKEKKDAMAAFAAGEAWTRYEGSASITSCQYDRIMSQGQYSSFPYGAYTAITISTWLVVICVSLAMMNFEWLKIWIAPKLYLIEYAASLMK